MTRPYTQRARAAATEATRARIVAAAKDAFMRHRYEDVTIGSVAQAAGVSPQTVMNHFGGKDALFAAAVAELSAELQARRDSATPGDVRGAVEALVDDYEITGDATVRALASEMRLRTLEPHLAQGRSWHRDWVRRMLAPPPHLIPPLVVATDVYAWKLLRRDQGLSRDATADAIFALVASLVSSPCLPPPKE